MHTASPASLLKQLAHHVRYRYRLRFQPRKNRVYTQFFRFPHQYRVLLEQLLPARLKADARLGERPLEVVVFACCSGEEVYTLSYLLAKHFPDLPVRIRGFDIVGSVIETARAGVYTKEQVYAGPFVTEEFVNEAFEVEGNEYRIKPELKQRTSFAVADMTDAGFISTLGKCDFVFAQNVLFHLPVEVVPPTFKNLYELLRPGASLFINGMDMDVRVQLTKQYSLEPVQYLIREIHEDACIDRGANWSQNYWGRVPFSTASRDWVRQYGTIFTRGG